MWFILFLGLLGFLFVNAKAANEKLLSVRKYLFITFILSCVIPLIIYFTVLSFNPDAFASNRYGTPSFMMFVGAGLSFFLIQLAPSPDKNVNLLPTASEDDIPMSLLSGEEVKWDEQYSGYGKAAKKKKKFSWVRYPLIVSASASAISSRSISTE